MTDTSPTGHSRARCQCGAVTLSAPAISLWAAHCHCTQCRRAHGAGFVTWVGYSATDCRIADSHEVLRWYASSPGAERGFCSRCGSMLFFHSSRWPGELHVAVGCLDTPLDRDPEAHVYWHDRASWSGVTLDDGLVRKG